MDNLNFCVVITTNEKLVSTEPPGDVEKYFINLFRRKLAHIANFLCRNYWYDLQRIYDSELKFPLMQKYQLE